MSATAVVFAYHDVGCRCLSALLAQVVQVALVVTHRDNPAENIWFANVRRDAYNMHGSLLPQYRGRVGQFTLG